MSTIADNNEKVFEYYNVLFPELRAMVIDEMDSTDRCRFTRCSKLCDKEAKASKNYIYGLDMRADYDHYITIRVSFDKSDNYPIFNYQLVFRNNECTLFLCNKTNSEFRTEYLDDSVDMVQYAAEQFKKLLKAHQRKIKYLSFSGKLLTTKLKDYDFGTDNLESLQSLGSDDSRNVSLYLSKLKRPLKNFYLRNKENGTILAENEQIHQVRDCLRMIDAKFTNSQMLQLSAQKVNIDIGDLTEQDIVKFIRSWQNGTIGKEIYEYEWHHLNKSKFDVTKLFQLLGKTFNENSKWPKYSLEIKHDKEHGKSARLLWFRCYYRLEFRLEKDTLYSWSTQNIEELGENYSYFLRTISDEH